MFNIPIKDVYDDGFHNYVRFQVIVRNVDPSKQQLTLGDLTQISSDLDNIDSSLEQFLNLVTSQYVMFNE